jgi:hypothetical protein
MKTFLIVIVIPFLLLCTNGNDLCAQNSANVPQVNFIPDVMNKVHILEQVGNELTGKTFDADSFPVYSGFPKIISGQSFEGGITCQMDSDNELEIVYGIGPAIQAWNLDGSNVPGWPVSLSYNVQGAPAYGDIDGDGQAEIVVGTSNFVGNAGAVYAFEKSGVAVTGFPVNQGATSRTIVLANLDNDNALEIITNKRIYPTGEVYVYKGNGSVLAGWPKPINHVPASSSAVGDITGDGIPEVIAESYLSVYAWDRNGNSLPGFPYSMPNGDVNSYSSPVLADVDGDNIREILFGSHVTGSGGGGFLYILKNNGTVLNNFPKQTSWWIYGPPVLGYINDDNVIDIAVGDQVGSGIPANFLYAWDKNGNVLNGFPVGPINAINNQVTLADLDNDNRLELFIDDNTQVGGMGKYLAFNHDGTPNNDWTVATTGTSFFNMPTLADINFDGRLDLIGAGFTAGGSNQTYVYVWNTNQQFFPSRAVNPVWQFNVRHNGVYGDVNVVGINTNSASAPDEFQLLQNFPNPFNPTTQISYSIRSKSHVTLQVHDATGRLVSTLLNEAKEAGHYSTTFDASGKSSGIYFYSLLVNGVNVETRKMLLVK